MFTENTRKNKYFLFYFDDFSYRISVSRSPFTKAIITVVILIHKMMKRMALRKMRIMSIY